ncbi:hypothetical protein ACFX2F_044166 [Malus domestica]
MSSSTILLLPLPISIERTKQGVEALKAPAKEDESRTLECGCGGPYLWWCSGDLGLFLKWVGVEIILELSNVFDSSFVVLCDRGGQYNLKASTEKLQQIQLWPTNQTSLLELGQALVHFSGPQPCFSCSIQSDLWNWNVSSVVKITAGKSTY